MELFEYFTVNIDLDVDEGFWNSPLESRGCIVDMLHNYGKLLSMDPKIHQLVII